MFVELPLDAYAPFCYDRAMSPCTFTRDPNGQIVQLEQFLILSPGRENGMDMMFGGEVLKAIDEISGSLATLFIAREGLRAVHVGEEVFFHKPIRSGECAHVVARVALSTDKIVCAHVVVRGGNPETPDAFDLRYEGFGLCAVIDRTRTLVRDLTPYTSTDARLVAIAQRVVEFQRNTRRALLEYATTPATT